MFPTSPCRLILFSALVAVLAVFGNAGTASAATYATPTGLKVASHTSSTVDLTWNAVKNAPRYRIQLATKSSMSGAVYFRVTENHRQMTGLKANTKYYFKVRVITADGGNLSSYSGAVSTTTDAPPPEFTKPAPTGLASTDQTTTALSLAWNAVAGAPRYRIQLSKKSDMSAATYYRFTDTNAQISSLAPATKYYLKVRVITADGVNMSAYSGSIAASTQSVVPPPSMPLRIGSFNVKCANCDGSLPEEGTWADRRATVVSTIMGQLPDVIGVQEAAQSWLKDSSGKSIDLSQFEDLRNRLKTAGGNYALANSNRNNCVKSTTPANCVAKDQGASKGTKVFYNAGTVDLLGQGSKKLESACSGCNERYVAWAALRQKSSGKKFFFATVHLEPTATYYAARIIQSQQAVAEIKAKNTEKLPVIVTGDFNSTRYQNPANDPYDKMVASGLVDPLGHTYKSPAISVKATAEKRIHANYNSFNNFNRAQTFYGLNENGSNLDYIFTSPMRVTEWETVVNLDSAGKLTGVIASDHNMIRATALLP